MEVMKKYTSLHPYQITLKQRRVKASTMQAQPVITLQSLLSGVKKYKIILGVYVRDSENIKVADLPEDVLIGWFAHELGHLVDYEIRSNHSMVVYGLKYIFSRRFKRKVEHEADYIAIKNGFHEEIIATKKYIFEHKQIDNGYKNKLKNYYLSIQDVRMCMEESVLP